MEQREKIAGNFVALQCRIALAIGLLFLLSARQAAANCGSAFCIVNSDFEVQGEWTDPGVRVGLRYEHIKQDQARRATAKIGKNDAAGLAHFPVLNINNNWIASLDYSFDQNWGVGVTLPWVQLEHDRLSIEAEGDGPKNEHWDFKQIGDVRVVGRYQTLAGTGTAGLRLGVKLPSGKTDIRNADGEAAERALQPGSGSADVIAGAFANGRFATVSLSWFVEGQYQSAVTRKDDYKPGDEVQLIGGLRYAFNRTFSALLQLNTRFKQRDNGANADRENSGGSFVFLSPGVSVSVGKAFQLYGFVQVPLYQKVNGVQLTAAPSLVVGASYHFF
jgi:hypothetical protein